MAARRFLSNVTSQQFGNPSAEDSYVRFTVAHPLGCKATIDFNTIDDPRHAQVSLTHSIAGVMMARAYHKPFCLCGNHLRGDNIQKLMRAAPHVQREHVAVLLPDGVERTEELEHRVREHKQLWVECISWMAEIKRAFGLKLSREVPEFKLDVVEAPGSGKLVYKLRGCVESEDTTVNERYDLLAAARGTCSARIGLYSLYYL